MSDVPTTPPAGVPRRQPTSRARRRTIVTRRELASRRWRPTSLLASAAVAEVDPARRRHREALASPSRPVDGLLTPMKAARRLRVGRTTLYRLAKEEQLTRILIGRCSRFVSSDLDDFIARRLAAARRQRAG